MLACLAKVFPLDTVTGERVELRLSAHNDRIVGRKVNGLDDAQWEPVMPVAPVLRITLFNGDFSQAVSAGQAALQVNLTELGRTRADLGQLAWQGAPVEIYAEDPGTGWPWTLRFKGKVTGYSAPATLLTLNASIDTEPFEADLLPTTYAGTGGAEGDENLKGKAKPLVLGWAMNVEPVLIDTVNSVYQFSGYGEIEEVTVLYERGSDFGAADADYADYTALVAATIPRGKWATCLADGLIRLGAPAYGVITGDIKGHMVGGVTPRLTGAIIAALAGIAGIDPELVDSDSLAALDISLPYPVNVNFNDQSGFLQTAQQIALPCNAQCGIGLDGRLFVTRISFDRADDLFIDAKGRSYPQVVESREESVSPPFWRYVLGANRSWRVHTSDEIAYEPPPIPRHDPASTSATFTANYAGALDAGQLPYTMQLKRLHGITDFSTSATWAVTSQGAISGATVAVVDGVVEIPSGAVIPPSTEIVVTSDIDGLVITSNIPVTRLDATPPTTGGGGGGGATTVTDNTLNSVTGTTMAALSDILTVKTGASGVIDFAGVLSIIATAASPDGLYGAQMRWKYRPISGSFTDVGSVINETVEVEILYDTELGRYFRINGSINVAASQTGLSATTDYEVQLWGARDSASPAKTISFGGTVSATGS
jgi:hypothetical protein